MPPRADAELPLQGRDEERADFLHAGEGREGQGRGQEGRGEETGLVMQPLGPSREPLPLMPEHAGRKTSLFKQTCLSFNLLEDSFFLLNTKLYQIFQCI